MNTVEGKPEQTGGDAVKFIKGLISGQNLWYTKAALDHLIFNQMQEYVSLGYLNRMERHAQREFNQTYSCLSDKKGFESESQIRALAWFGFVVFDVILVGRLI